MPDNVSRETKYPYPSWNLPQVALRAAPGEIAQWKAAAAAQRVTLAAWVRSVANAEVRRQAEAVKRAEREAGQLKRWFGGSDDH